MLYARNRCIRENFVKKISGCIQRSFKRITASSDTELQCTEVILFDEDCYSFEKEFECIFSWNMSLSSIFHRVYQIDFIRCYVRSCMIT